jgi:3-phenylpropionate/trans-cinnamate dioxygenase ferredoxin reductase component
VSDPTSIPVTDHDRVCIVGAGHAGGELALALRQQGCTGSIVLIGNEAHAPYQRPPLSKAYLKGECEAASLCLRQQVVYDRSKIELELNVCVARIDPHAKTLSLADGRTIGYTQLALTTGGRARRLDTADALLAERAANFHYFRTIDDVLKIRARLTAGARLVIVGGGYIGLEVAAAAVSRGVSVTVLEALPRVLARVTAPEMSTFYEQVHREAGVDVRTGIAVTGFEMSASGEEVSGVKCSDGVVVPADVIVAGIGITPNTELALAAGLRVDNGVVVDEYARTSDPCIVAAGDCTNHPNALTGRRVRLESVPNAVEQARSAAATLVGKQLRHDAVPWFWTDQYDLKMQMVGLSQGYDSIVLRGSMNKRSFTIFYLKDGGIIASDSVNRPQEFMISKRLVAAHSRPDPASLADESTPLKALAPGG